MHLTYMLASVLIRINRTQTLNSCACVCVCVCARVYMFFHIRRQIEARHYTEHNSYIICSMHVSSMTSGLFALARLTFFQLENSLAWLLFI